MVASIEMSYAHSEFCLLFCDGIIHASPQDSDRDDEQYQLARFLRLLEQPEIVDGELSTEDVTNALDEMLVAGGSLSLKLLGASGVNE